MSLTKKLLTRLYMRNLLSTPEGRAHLLNQIAEAEDNGEARVFDDCLAQVDDPQLQKMIKRHRDDEIRHGQLFREALARTGVDPGPVPEELLALDRIDRKLGGFFTRPVSDAQGVLTAYLILQAIEERALEQFALYEPIFAEVDPPTAAVFAEVRADEERHLKYCEAISRRYEPDEGKRQAELLRVRLIEAQAHRETEQANMRYVLEHDLMPGAFSRWFWTRLGDLQARRRVLPLTPQLAEALGAL